MVLVCFPTASAGRAANLSYEHRSCLLGCGLQSLCEFDCNLRY